MIVVTGAAGFIASCLARALNDAGHKDLILVDRFDRMERRSNYLGKFYRQLVDRIEFPTWLSKNAAEVDFVFHLGARTDTAEQDWDLFVELNLGYSQTVWGICADNGIPLVYASSAATYGGGENGFSDDHVIVPSLQPLNPYGRSKQEFDLWALSQSKTPPFWAGIKFFNVYGPNEYHKGRMASVIWHTFRQISETGKMKLFRSHHPEFADGEQSRDFIYVKDITSILQFLMEKQPASGLYNAGTGKARTFYDLASQVFKSLERIPQIEFIDTPADIRDNYQYFTEATMEKLLSQGYNQPFLSLEAGVDEYVKKYLKEDLIH